MTIPIELVMEWAATENLPEAQRDSRRLRALLHAVESGLMTVAMLNGGLAGEEKPTEQGSGKASSDEANKAADSTPPVSKPPLKDTGEPGGTTPKDTGGAGTKPPADVYLRFLQLAEAIRGLPALPPLDPLEERILSWIARASREEQRLSVRDMMSQDELGAPATIHGRLKSMRAKGWITLNGEPLKEGDGAEISDVETIAVEAKADGTEVLLFDLA